MSAQETAALRFPVPFWPYGQIAAVVFMAAVMELLGFQESTRIALVVGVVWLALLAVVHVLWVRRRRPGPQPVLAGGTTAMGNTPDGDLAGLEGPAHAPR
ncbi:hypothetical protein GCM10010377_17610 [Streptomyces viridiviolaceus]|uniref:Amino acid permease n=1 Tax=Streptomyces viridiviolaceus TaxID=68282 RepID=A0ABW2DTC4_9ACTN|nr:hypothetical protein [Streptomyces viridiviolaceus]GHB27979.1 hypothetical protein GCM10010377_17610 [Streptomyces viridiviolaceus]